MAKKAADFMQQQDGYLGTQLHKSIRPDGKFLYVNVAFWASLDHFQKAIGAMHQSGLPYQIDGVTAYPSLYEVQYSDLPFALGKKVDQS